MHFRKAMTFIEILDKTGYQNTYFKKLSMGICTIYCGIK